MSDDPKNDNAAAPKAQDPKMPKASRAGDFVAFPSLDEMKAWVRRELALLQTGHSEETRKNLNP